MQYNFNGVEHTITDAQLDRLCGAINSYEALLKGRLIPNLEQKWNLNTGKYYGVIVNVHYNQYNDNESYAIADILVSDIELLRVKVQANNLLSVWRSAYINLMGTDQYGAGNELVGLITEVQLYTRFKDYKLYIKKFTDVENIRFLTEQEARYVCDTFFELDYGQGAEEDSHE